MRNPASASDSRFLVPGNNNLHQSWGLNEVLISTYSYAKKLATKYLNCIRYFPTVNVN